MASRVARAAFMLLAAASTVSSLYVLPDSECAAMCLGNSTSSSTEPSMDTSDVACLDEEYSTDANGIKFRNCIECLKKSEAVDGEDSDFKWMLYNMRFALNTCFYNPKFKIESPCYIRFTCEPIRSAISVNLDKPEADTYDYCTTENYLWDKNPTWSCTKCMDSSDNQNYLANFMQMLRASCEQRPEPGKAPIYRGEIFSNELLNITASQLVLPGEGGAKSNDITTGTIVGIAVGAGLFLVGLAALIWAYCRRKKKRLAAEANAADQTPPPDRSNASSFTAAHHSPFLNVGDHKKSPSVRSTEYELREKQNFTTNAEYYARYEDDLRAGRQHPSYNLDPRAAHGPGSVLPTHRAYDPRVTMSRNTPSPVPPSHQYNHHRRTDTSESFALQAYLNANDAGSYQGSSRSRSATPSGRGSGRPSAEHVTTGVATATTLTSIPPPPPGPPPTTHSRSGSKHSNHSQAPSITVPTVPRVKVPKRYSPPTIVVDAASPDGSRMHISEPIHSHEQRFQDKPPGGGSGQQVVATDEVDPRTDMDPRYYSGERTINTGKSTLYG